MSAKTSPARRAAFLRALGETGNHTIAATHAKVSRSWVTLHKATDPGFRAACDAAVAKAAATAEAMRQAGGPVTPADQWRYFEGHETVIRGGNGRRAVVSRARLKAWTAGTEALFLETLAATANVKAACAAAGLSVPSAYVHRSKHADFARRWAEAIAIGADRLEWQLLKTAINVIERDRYDPASPIPVMTAEQAIRLMQMHKKSLLGWNGNRSHKLPRVRSLDEVRAGIVRKVEAILRQRGDEAEIADS